MNCLSRYTNLGDDRGYKVVVDEAGQITLTAQQGRPGPVSDLTMVMLTLSSQQCQELIALLEMAITSGTRRRRLSLHSM
jgi:hypothetical protein